MANFFKKLVGHLTVSDEDTTVTPKAPAPKPAPKPAPQPAPAQPAQPAAPQPAPEQPAKPDAPQPAPKSEPKTPAAKSAPDDAIITEAYIIKTVLEAMRRLFGGKQKVLKDRNLVLWVSDGARFILVDTMEFHDNLLCGLTNDGFPINDVAVKPGEAPEGSTPIMDAMAMEIVNGKVPVMSKSKAEITIFQGRGTLAKPTYLITPQGAPYAIGRNAEGDSAISIVGDPNDPNYERNKYVRSHHARIEYMGDHGFRFFVEQDGTYSVGSRTQIRRKGMAELIELNNPRQAFELKDGDVIILGKNVELLWTLVM